MWEHSILQTSKKGRNRGPLLILHGEVSMPLITFSDKTVVEQGPGYLLHSGKHPFLFAWSKPSLVLWETGVGVRGLWELAGTATGLGWLESCSALKYLLSLLIKGQAHNEASRVVFRNWNQDCWKSPCWKINPLSGSKSMYFGIFLDKCGFTIIIRLNSPKLNDTSWSKDGDYVANTCQLHCPIPMTDITNQSKHCFPWRRNKALELRGTPGSHYQLNQIETK